MKKTFICMALAASVAGSGSIAAWADENEVFGSQYNIDLVIYSTSKDIPFPIKMVKFKSFSNHSGHSYEHIDFRLTEEGLLKFTQAITSQIGGSTSHPTQSAHIGAGGSKFYKIKGTIGSPEVAEISMSPDVTVLEEDNRDLRYLLWSAAITGYVAGFRGGYTKEVDASDIEVKFEYDKHTINKSGLYAKGFEIRSIGKWTVGSARIPQSDIHEFYKFISELGINDVSISPGGSQGDPMGTLDGYKTDKILVSFPEGGADVQQAEGLVADELSEIDGVKLSGSDISFKGGIFISKEDKDDFEDLIEELLQKSFEAGVANGVINQHHVDIGGR